MPRTISNPIEHATLAHAPIAVINFHNYSARQANFTNAQVILTVLRSAFETDGALFQTLCVFSGSSAIRLERFDHGRFACLSQNLRQA